MYNLLN